MDLFQDSVHAPFSFGEAGGTGALLIHGFPGTPAEVRILGEDLARHAVFAKGILLPGFGQDIVQLGEKDRQAWLLAATSSWVEIQATNEHSVLIGYSMGGSLALHLAAAAPPDRLVLLAPFWRFPQWIAHQFLPFFRYLKSHVSPLDLGGDLDDPAFQQELKRFMPDLDFEDDETRRFVREELVLPMTIIEEVWRLGREAYELAPAVHVPTLVVQGNEDHVVHPVHTRQLVTRLRQSADVSFFEIPGDHAFTKSRGPYLDLVRTFLNPLLPMKDKNSYDSNAAWVL